MMDLEGIKYVLRNLKNRKTRTFLTSLSILIGIIAIYIFISFGLGLYVYLQELSQGSAIDKLIIQPKGGMTMPGLDSNFQLTEEDIKAIERVPGVYEVTGTRVRPAEVIKGNKRIYTLLLSYDPKKTIFLDIMGVGIEKGRLLQKGDRGKVMLGYNYLLENKIFSKPYELNQKINVQGKELTIVGFLEPIGNPPDDAQIYITNDYAKELYPNISGYGWVIARVNLKEINSIAEKIENSLRKERELKRGEEDFFVQSFDDLIQSFSGALNLVVGFIILIALISVLVSAINTSNTMITSVLERYKEIGIMKSIGAKNSKILFIFLFESALIGFVAGLIGVLVGAGLSYLGGTILASLGWSFLKPFFSIWLFIGCVLFATLTGAISGVLPAIRASKTNPVDALRYE